MNTVEFKKMLIDKGIANLDQLQAATGLTKPTLISYKNGARRPSITGMTKIIRGLNMSKAEVKKVFPEEVNIF